MGSGGGVINNWDQMKEYFLKKYQDYCRSIELKDKIFQMVARPNETLEEYVEHFQYNLQRFPYALLHSNLSLSPCQSPYCVMGLK